MIARAAKFAFMLLAIGLLALALPRTAVGQDDTERIVNRYADSSWFDSESGSYKEPKVSEGEQDSPIRTRGFAAKPSTPKAKKTKNSKNGGGNNTGGGGGWFSSAALGDLLSGFTLFWLGLLLISIVGALAYFSFRNYLPRRKDPDFKPKTIEIDPTKVEDLPFEVPEVKSFSNPIEQIQAFFQAGRIREAIIMLYGFKLLTLDQANRIELQKGKTNRTYLRELKHQQLSHMLETTMLSFEDVFFGHHQISQDRFLTSFNMLDEFQTLCLQGEVR